MHIENRILFVNSVINSVYCIFTEQTFWSSKSGRKIKPTKIYKCKI